MATPQAQPETTLVLTRTIKASREKVFAAWTQAETVVRWFAPAPTYTCSAQMNDVRPGGRYTISLHHVGGNEHHVSGLYHEVLPPSKLSFSWSWDKFPERGDSLVTIELTDAGDGTTLLTLTHTLFPDSATRDRHGEGWNAGLDNMVALFANA